MNCPACDYTSNTLFLHTFDYFLTQKAFDIHKCDDCGLLFTTPRPSDTELPAYYESPEYLSHPTNNTNLKARLYNLIRKINLSQKYKLIETLTEKGKMLDYGCGSGEFLKTCQNKGWITSGIEINENARNFAIRENKLEVYPESQIKHFDKESFDLITLWHVLEHIPNLNERIQDFYQLLKPNGRILIAVPNVDSWDAQFYKEKWAAWDVPRHLYHYNYKSLQKTMERQQFSFVKSMPMKLDAFYICLLSEQYKKNSFPYPLAFVNGLRSNLAAKNNPQKYSSIISVFKKG